jgi:hypothetical protein
VASCKSDQNDASSQVDLFVKFFGEVFTPPGNEASTWKSEDCPGGLPNVLPRLPLFDGVGSPNIPNPHFLKPWSQIKHSIACEVPFIIPIQVLDPSSVLPPSCLSYARTFPSLENPTWSHKIQTTTHDSISLYKGHKLSLFSHYCQLISGFVWWARYGLRTAWF